MIFPDTSPDSLPPREAFEHYIEKGGACMGFHFSAFALKPSNCPKNRDWYHNNFLGSGEYGSNNWRPTTAILQVETKHPFTKNLQKTFTAAPKEWSRWQNDLHKNPEKFYIPIEKIKKCCPSHVGSTTLFFPCISLKPFNPFPFNC